MTEMTAQPGPQERGEEEEEKIRWRAGQPQLMRENQLSGGGDVLSRERRRGRGRGREIGSLLSSFPAVCSGGGHFVLKIVVTFVIIISAE